MPSVYPALALSLLALAAAVPAAAQTYRDLPGVRKMEPLNSNGDNVVCDQILVDRDYPFESSRGPRYDTVYKCRRGDGPVFQGSDLPPSLYREKRGLGY